MARSLSSLELSRAIKKNIVSGSIGTLFGICMGGAFLTGFALRLGASPLQIGLLGSLPLVVYPVQILASYISERTGERKKIWAWTAILQRALWIPIVLIPFLFARSNPQICIKSLLLVVLFSSLLGSIGVPLWYSWWGDIIPSKTGGSFWAKRNVFVNSVALVSSLLLARFLDLFPKSETAQGFIGFAIIFGIGIACGEIDILIHRHIPDPGMSLSLQKVKLLPLLKKPFQHSNFRRYALFITTWNFAVYIMAPFVNVYFLKILGMRYFDIYLLNGLHLGMNILFSQVWGYLGDKFGHKPIMRVCVLGMAIHPLVYLFVTPENYFVLLPIMFGVLGTLSGGIGIASINLLLGLSPRENRSIFVGVFHSLVGLAASIAPLVAGGIAQVTQDFMFSFMGNNLVNLHLLFLLSMFARLGCLPFLNKVEEKQAKPVGLVIKQITVGNPFRLIPNLILFQSKKEENRVKAIKSLGRSKSILAVQELISALDDPSLRVRREAAIALGKIGSKEAVEPLIKKLDLPEAGIQPYAVEALGEIKDKRSADHLIEHLKDSDRSVRERVIKALSKIEDKESFQSLIALLLKEENDPSVFASAIDSLSKTGEAQALWAILPIFRNIKSPLLRRQLALNIGNLLGDEGEFYTLLQSELSIFGQKTVRIMNEASRTVRREEKRIGINGYYKKLNELIGQAEGDYLGKRWAQCIEKINYLSMKLAFSWWKKDGQYFDDSTFQESKQDYAVLKKRILSLHKKLGINLCFLDLLANDETKETLSFEEALLAVYALKQIVKLEALPLVKSS